MDIRSDKVVNEINFRCPPDVRYLKRLTTPTGILQHAKYAIPDRKLGYTLDDNARAFVATVWHYSLFKKKSILDLTLVYLSFIVHAKTDENDFYNFLSFDHRFLDEARSQDCFGRAFWSLGFASYANVRRDITLQSKYLAAEVLPTTKHLTSLRAKAYTILGLTFLCQMEPQTTLFSDRLKKLTDDLLTAFRENNSGDWHWFEKEITYGNALLPYALFQSFKITRDRQSLEIAKKSLLFLHENSIIDGKPSPVGQNGWYSQGKQRAQYDQQAIDPAYMVLANCAAFKVTEESDYKKNALFWFSWFHGNNLQGEPLYDELTGGCFDGLTSDGVNLNQGAESIVCYLLAYLALSEVT